jgi:hypothetical protein
VKNDGINIGKYLEKGGQKKRWKNPGTNLITPRVGEK